MNNLKHPVTGKPQYLQLKVPQTTNGTLLAYDANQQPIYKTVYLPITAKRKLEQKSTRLPTHLRPIISVITNQEKPIEQPKPQAPKPAETTPPVNNPVQSEPAKNKGGRPSKKVQNASI